MSSRGNIVLAGIIGDNNLGDQAIFQTTKEMVRKIAKEHIKEDIEIRGIDLSLMADSKFGHRVYRKLRRMTFDKIRALYMDKNHLEVLKGTDDCKYLKNAWKNDIDDNTRLIIFTGGGIIKYKYQNFEFLISELVKVAEEKKIPVMMSAAGVEGYDAGDERCLLLKKALNSPMVKVITTRDDIDVLRDCFMEKNSKTYTQRVADPACSYSRYFTDIKKNEGNNVPKKIGLGVIRPSIFKDNDIEFEERDVTLLYLRTFKELKKAGYDVKLFCNGMKFDYDYALELKRILNEKSIECEVLRRSETTTQLCSDICSFDGIIAGRLHATILAYSFGVPGVGLVWNVKQKLFGEIIGCPERFIQFEDLKPKIIVERIKKAIEQGYDNEFKKKYCDTTYSALENFIVDYAEKTEA